MIRKWLVMALLILLFLLGYGCSKAKDTGNKTYVLGSDMVSAVCI